MSKHTSGEWRWFKRDNAEDSEIPFGIDVPKGMGSCQPIVDTAAFPPNTHSNLERMEADIKLIAAAPDLLAKCIKVSEWLNRLADAAEKRASTCDRFTSLKEANLADAKNYRTTAKDIERVINKATE